jgi:Holliday junction DNA helicase RuvA
MIDHLEGVVAERGPTSVRLAVGPVRLELAVPLSTARGLPEPGGRTALWVHLVWKEEGPQLFGFGRRAERDLFRLLLGVQGVGPTGAISLLSHLPAEDLLRQIRARSVEALTRVPRIGAKTAGRILIDLGPKADRMSLEGEPAGATAVPGALQARLEDAVSALAALGYAGRDARRAAESVEREDGELPLDEHVRRALQKLSRREG